LKHRFFDIYFESDNLIEWMNLTSEATVCSVISHRELYVK